MNTQSAPHIFLVDDYAPNIMIATMMLEFIGYHVTSVQSGAEALRVLESRTTPFVAILMDVQMQGMNGLETTKRIREIESRKGFSQPIIGVTAHALASDRDRCLDAGMNDYISKPIHPDILENKLKHIMQAHL